MNGPDTQFVLPPSVVGRVDVSHLVTELERVDNEQTTASIHEKVGSSQPVDIRVSKQLAEFLEVNKLDITASQERNRLITQLRALKENAPVIHMTFAVQADGGSLQQLVQWLRTSVHPQAVIEVGLQPALIAGVSIRTPNHVHDLSMRAMIKEHHDDLVKELEALRATS